MSENNILCVDLRDSAERHIISDVCQLTTNSGNGNEKLVKSTNKIVKDDKSSEIKPGDELILLYYSPRIISIANRRFELIK